MLRTIKTFKIKTFLLEKNRQLREGGKSRINIFLSLVISIFTFNFVFGKESGRFCSNIVDGNYKELRNREREGSRKDISIKTAKRTEMLHRESSSVKSSHR